jgi:ABC-type uncharacterized transport system permease subunit
MTKDLSNFLSKFDRTNIPILLALFLMIASMLLLTVSPSSVYEVMNPESSTNFANSSSANNLMSLAYLLLFIGLGWKFIEYIRKKESK